MSNTDPSHLLEYRYDRPVMRGECAVHLTTNQLTVTWPAPRLRLIAAQYFVLGVAVALLLFVAGIMWQTFVVSQQKTWLTPEEKRRFLWPTLGLNVICIGGAAYLLVIALRDLYQYCRWGFLQDELTVDADQIHLVQRGRWRPVHRHWPTHSLAKIGWERFKPNRGGPLVGAWFRLWLTNGRTPIMHLACRDAADVAAVRTWLLNACKQERERRAAQVI